jgi:RimJ/RimL family protein N-acetyltransferase
MDERTDVAGEVTIRDVEPDDLPIFFDDQRDPVAVEMAAFPARDRAAFDAHWAKILADETTITKTVLLDGAVAGSFGCWRDDEGRCEVGYWLGRSFWGKGVATAALALFVAGIDERPLFARVATHNAASIRVLQKCGFTIEGGPSEPAADGIREQLLILTPRRAGT